MFKYRDYPLFVSFYRGEQVHLKSEGAIVAWVAGSISLPTVSIVVPNLQNDMHDGTIVQGDTWLQQHLDGYVQWAKTHNSLFVLTWDEDDNSQNDQIPTIFVGPMVKAGSYSEQINHYTVLRTLEDMYGLLAANNSANVSAIADCWQP